MLRVTLTMDGHDGSSSNPVASGSKSAAPDLPALQAASHLIHEQLTKDAQTIPDLGDMLTIRELIRSRMQRSLLIFNACSRRTILVILYRVSWGLPCPFPKAKTYRHSTSLMGAFSVYVDKPERDFLLLTRA